MYEHNRRPNKLHEQFAILRKCPEKFEYLIYAMLLIRKKRPTLKTAFKRNCLFDYVHFSISFYRFCPFFVFHHISFSTIFTPSFLYKLIYIWEWWHVVARNVMFLCRYFLSWNLLYLKNPHQMSSKLHVK